MPRCSAPAIWGVRDLESRNGTLVGDAVVHGDVLLHARRVIRIGNSQLAFVHDLTKAFPDSGGWCGRRRTGEALGDTGVTGTDRRFGQLRADDHHASPRPNPIPRTGRRRDAIRTTTRRPPGFAGWRSSWPRPAT